jgi:hypothetical protein
MLEHVIPQVVPERVGVPVGPPEQMLDAIWRGVARHLGQLPTVLALGGGEQTAKIIPRSLARLGASEVCRKTFAYRLQLLGP